VVRQPKRKLGQNDDGFTLIEGMLAAVILAIGLLGLASMQAFALVRNGDANEMTRVTNFAADIVERIQFNRRNALAYNGVDTNVACVIDSVAQPMARGDCDQWRNLLTGGLATGLGGLRGQVAVAAVGPTAPPLNQNRVAVTITWTGAAGAGKSALQRQVIITTVVAPE
jgi:type IV pilus assembly protein PilV